MTEVVKPERDWFGIVAAGRCPECGLDAGGVDRGALAAAFKEQGRVWSSLLTGTPEAELRAHRLPGAWSALEYGAHVRDVLRTFAERAERMLMEDRPVLGWWDHEATAIAERYNEQQPLVVAADLTAQASRVASIAGRVDGLEWHRAGTRRPGEVFTIDGILRFALHEAHHHLWDAQRALVDPIDAP